MKNTLILIIAVLSFTACGTGKSSQAENEQFRALSERIKDMHFEIENNWASPRRMARRNLIGNSNYIRFAEDEVDVYLPYFGVRQTGGYGTEGGIIYKGTPQNLEIIEQPEKNQLDIRFEGEHKGELLEFIIRIFGNGKTHTTVNSTQRDGISYDGELEFSDVVTE